MRTALLVILIFVSVASAWSPFSKKPKDVEYSKKQWLQMITQPEHQVTPIWKGVGAGTIKKNSGSNSGGGLSFLKSPAGILEHQCTFDDLVDKDPLMFLPALTSKDQRVILTGMYIYNRHWPDKASSAQKSKIANAYRLLLSNPDTSVRAAVFNQFAAHRLLTAADVIKGLSDEAHDVRYLAGFHISVIFENPPVYTKKDGKFHKGNAKKVIEFIEIKRKLAPVLLQHLNETNPFTRDDIATAFRNLFTKKVYSGTGTTNKIPGFFPARIDWIKASWQKREETKKIWTKWWAENGEEALKFAHPPQN